MTTPLQTGSKYISQFDRNCLIPVANWAGKQASTLATMAYQLIPQDIRQKWEQPLEQKLVQPILQEMNKPFSPQQSKMDQVWEKANQLLQKGKALFGPSLNPTGPSQENVTKAIGILANTHLQLQDPPSSSVSLRNTSKEAQQSLAINNLVREVPSVLKTPPTDSPKKIEAYRPALNEGCKWVVRTSLIFGATYLITPDVFLISSIGYYAKRVFLAYYAYSLWTHPSQQQPILQQHQVDLLCKKAQNKFDQLNPSFKLEDNSVSDFKNRLQALSPALIQELLQPVQPPQAASPIQQLSAAAPVASVAAVPLTQQQQPAPVASVAAVPLTQQQQPAPAFAPVDTAAVAAPPNQPLAPAPVAAIPPSTPPNETLLATQPVSPLTAAPGPHQEGSQQAQQQ